MPVVADTALILGLAGITGTLVSPWLAARFASRQQEHALEHERARQERAFEHERTMHDEEELRSLLDEVAASQEDCFTGMNAAFAKFLVVGWKIGRDEEGHAKLEELSAASDRLRLLTGRLAIRLGAHHPVKHAAVEVQNALGMFAGGILNIAFMAEEAELIEYGEEMEQGKSDFAATR